MSEMNLIGVLLLITVLGVVQSLAIGRLFVRLWELEEKLEKRR